MMSDQTEARAGDGSVSEFSSAAPLSRRERALKVSGLPFRLRLLQRLTEIARWVPTIFVIAVGALLLASIISGGLGWEWYVVWFLGGSLTFAVLVLMNFEVQRVELFEYEQSEGVPNNLSIELRDAAEYDAQWQLADRRHNRQLAQDERELRRRHPHERSASRVRLRLRRKRRPPRSGD